MDSAQLGSVYYASSSLSFAPLLLLQQLGMQFLFIYFEATLMVSWLYKAPFLSPSLSLLLCGSHHEVASGSVECIWHITFGSLLSNFCVCFGRHFGFVIYGHVKRSRSWSRAVIPLPLPSSLCAFYGHQNSGAAAFDMRLRCGPRKSFHFNFFIFFFAFHFSVFGFSFSIFFFYRILFAVQLAIAKPEERG